MSFFVLPERLSALQSAGDEISLLSSFIYCIFAVEGCLELAALQQSPETNRSQAFSYGRLALAVAVRAPPISFHFPAHSFL